ncbi:MAG: hypothetical protein IKO25_02000 [Clostridia bacterium]|nr:hypothetical protein [Clostridia bacterium]
MGKYDGWSLDRLWSEYNRYKQEQGRAAGREERLRRAYNNTKAPFGLAKDTRSALEKAASGVDLSGVFSGGGVKAIKWKGNSRDDFNDSMEDVDGTLKKAINTDLDDYRDAIETERMKAQRKSGLYIPIVSDVYSAIKKWGN